MSAVINTNVAAIRTHGVYNRNNDNMNAAMTRIATAQKINSPRDNASDWAISERMRERINSLNQANQNVQNDTAMTKTAVGGIQNTIDILKTVKDKILNAANATTDDESRKIIQTEVNSLIEQVNDNASNVKFNGMILLDGSKTDKSASNVATIQMNIIKTDDTNWGSNTAANANLQYLSSDFGATGRNVKLTYTNVGDTASSVTTAGQFESTDKVSALITDMNARLAEDGANFRLQYVRKDDAFDHVINQDGTPAKSKATGIFAVGIVSGADGGFTLSKLEVVTGSSPISSFRLISTALDVNSGSGVVFQVGDEVGMEITFNIPSMKFSDISGTSGIDVTTETGRTAGLTAIDKAISTALSTGTKLGSVETRLGYTADNLSTQIENLAASDSAIRDADMAKEMTDYMKYIVLSQASEYMLAQAGQNSSAVLNLLQA